MLRELEHIQVDGLRMAYLFFYNRQGWQGLSHEAMLASQTHAINTLLSGFPTQLILQ